MLSPGKDIARRETNRREVLMRAMLGAVILLTLAIVGCGKSDESLAKRAGSKVGETLTDFASGVGAGVDKKMIVTVELSKALVDAGISRTIAKSGGIDHPDAKTMSVYLTSQKPFKATLIAMALNREGLEIGRATADIDLAESDAKYATFAFPGEMDTQLVAKYTIDVRK